MSPVTHTYVSTAHPVAGKVDSAAWNATHTISIVDADVDPDAAISSDKVAFSYVEKTGAYTLTDDDYTVNCLSGSFPLTLLTAVGRSGKIFNIKNSGTGIITVLTTLSQVIDGGLTFMLYQYESITVQSTGTSWIIL